jgi:hypothetical protein
MTGGVLAAAALRWTAMTSRRLGMAAVLACCLALPAPVAARTSVDFVRADAAKAAPGGSLTLSGRVSNTGRRARHPQLRLSLRGGEVRGSLGRTGIGRVRRHSRRSFELDAMVPDRLAAGRYFVVACIRKRCKASKKRVRLEVPPAVDESASSGVEPPPLPPAPPVTPPVVTNTVYVPVPPPTPPPANFQPGARTGGDVLFPQIGNGGYDATHYELTIQYTPGTRQLIGQTTMTATATQDLSQFSLDLQGFDVLAVTVDGRPAEFTRELPAAASPRASAIRSKLVVTPAAGIRTGASFAVNVFYAGVPETIVDPDGGEEGWFFTQTGGVVVCQPIGCQGVYPSNNVPYDKATFDETIVVPAGMSGIGNGDLVSTSTAGGLTTWKWHMGEPISTYLVTATVGNYSLAQSTDGAGHTIYDFVDTSANAPFAAFSPAQLAGLQANLDRDPDTVDFLSGVFGPYPFGSFGAIVANARTLGYALEVATKPVYDGAPGDVYTFTHELAHQWIGDSVTYRQIRDMWIHEGAATWIEWYWGSQRDGLPPTPVFFDLFYDDPGFDWSLPPALPAADTIFTEPVYNRGAMTYEALRQIVGDTTFFQILRTLYERYGYGSITTPELIAVAEEVAGRDLDRFFTDYLYTPGRPPRPDAYGALAAAERAAVS